MSQRFVSDATLRQALARQAAGLGEPQPDFPALMERLRASPPKRSAPSFRALRPLVLIPLACLGLAACALGLYFSSQVWVLEPAADGSFIPVLKDSDALLNETRELPYTGSWSDDATMTEAQRADWFGLRVAFPGRVGSFELHLYPGHRAAISHGVSLATTMEQSPLNPHAQAPWRRLGKALVDEDEYQALAKDWDIYKSLFANYWDGDAHLVLFVIAQRHYREGVTNSRGLKRLYLGIPGSLWGEYESGQTGVYPGYAAGEEALPDEKHKPHIRDFQQFYWDAGEYTYLLFGSEGTRLGAEQAVAFARAFMAAQAPGPFPPSP